MPTVVPTVTFSLGAQLACQFHTINIFLPPIHEISTSGSFIQLVDWYASSDGTYPISPLLIVSSVKVLIAIFVWINSGPRGLGTKPLNVTTELEQSYGRIKFRLISCTQFLQPEILSLKSVPMTLDHLSFCCEAENQRSDPHPTHSSDRSYGQQTGGRLGWVRTQSARTGDKKYV